MNPKGNGFVSGRGEERFPETLNAGSNVGKRIDRLDVEWKAGLAEVCVEHVDLDTHVVVFKQAVKGQPQMVAKMKYSLPPQISS